MLHDGLAQLPYLVFERPFWDGTVDEGPVRPRVDVFLLFLALVLGGVLEEVAGEIERSRRAQCTDEVGVLCELGVQRSGDEHALRRHGQRLCRTLHVIRTGLFGRVCVPTSILGDDVIALAETASKMASVQVPVDMSNPAVQDFLSLVRSVVPPVCCCMDRVDPSDRLQVLTPLSLLVNIATVLVCSVIVRPSIGAYRIRSLHLTLTGMVIPQSASSDCTLLRSRPIRHGSPSTSSSSTSSRSVIVSCSC